MSAHEPQRLPKKPDEELLLLQHGAVVQPHWHLGVWGQFGNGRQHGAVLQPTWHLGVCVQPGNGWQHGAVVEPHRHLGVCGQQGKGCDAQKHGLVVELHRHLGVCGQHATGWKHGQPGTPGMHNVWCGQVAHRHEPAGQHGVWQHGFGTHAGGHTGAQGVEHSGKSAVHSVGRKVAMLSQQLWHDDASRMPRVPEGSVLAACLRRLW